MPIACAIVYGMPAEFPTRVESYCSQMESAVRANKHHDHRMALLLNFLRDAFSIEAEEIELQQKMKAGSVRGRMDAFFRSILFEMKCDLESERKDALTELKKYFESQREPRKYIGVVSDGTEFEIYHYSAGQVSLVRAFKIQAEAPAIAFHELDELFATRPRVPATSQEICHCFGLRSIILSRSLDLLRSAFELVSSQPGVRTKFREWDVLLAKVYGAPTNDQDMFLKHTYLALLSRCIVVEVLFHDVPRDAALCGGLINGDFFRGRNIQNLAEEDFFAWGFGNEAEPILIDLIANLFRRLDGFRFDMLDQDLLKMLYQELVEPADRHNLGEYYTPDWLAQLTLEEIDYRGGRLLDPACGSGTFLYFAIRRLRETGRKGADLVHYVLENVIGIDVHPLAVLMAKANMLLGLGADIRSQDRPMRLPVYLADTLLTGEDVRENTLHVPAGKSGAFRIPFASLEKERPIDDLVDDMVRLAERAVGSKESEKHAKEAFATGVRRFEDREAFFWRENFKLLVKMIRSRSNTVWGFILKNAYRPVYLRKQKCRYIVGNPPWLSYRYIKDEDYKSRVRELTFGYGLLQPSQRKLFTQIDTSTLFFVHCMKEFLDEHGTIAFVMPKSAIAPSQQHAAFQRLGFTALHDFSDVSPLFNVRSCLMVRKLDEVRQKNIPLTLWRARFDQKNPKLAHPKQVMESERSEFSFPEATGPRSPYYALFINGATIVPRCLWFVEPPKESWILPREPYLQTTASAQQLAKEPWKVELKGKVEADFLFATVLAENLLPFGVRHFSLVVLPAQKTKDGTLSLVNHLGALRLGAVWAHDWIKNAEEIWSARKKPSQPSLQEYVDWQRKLSTQDLKAPVVVIYATSGTNLASAIVRAAKIRSVGRIQVSGFVADTVTYRYYAQSLEEAHYLVGILNSHTVNERIKPYQPQGLWGERHIHRRPFEVCAIPRFDPDNSLHRKIAAVAKEAEDTLRPYLLKIEGLAAKARAMARHITKNQIAQLDELVGQLIGTTSPNVQPRKKRGNPGNPGLLSLLL